MPRCAMAKADRLNFSALVNFLKKHACVMGISLYNSTSYQQDKASLVCSVKRVSNFLG